MTAVLDTPVVSPVVVCTATDAPLSAQPVDYLALVDAGVIPIDIRGQSQRQVGGVLSGALAIEATDVLASLTPDSPDALRLADDTASWLLVSDDGHEAEWLAWHLQARGVAGARFVVGGYRALRRAGVTGRLSGRELAAISAH